MELQTKSNAALVKRGLSKTGLPLSQLYQLEERNRHVEPSRRKPLGLYAAQTINFSFSFSTPLVGFENLGRSTGERVSGISKNAELDPSIGFDGKSPNLPFSFSRCVKRKGHRARALLFTALTLTGCQHAQIKTHSIEADFKQDSTVSVEVPQDILQPEIPRDIVAIGGENDRALKTTLSKRPRQANLKSPLRFAFTAVPVDLILRRIAEYTDLEFFADEELIANSSVTLDLTVNNSEEIYSLVDMVGSMLGVEVKWDGKKAIFNRSEGSVIRPIDGYLITPINLTPQTQEIISARYDVQCSLITSLTLCLGENAALDATQKFIRAVDNARDLVSYRLVDTKIDLARIGQALAIQDRVVIQKLDGNQWLLVSNDPRHFTLLLDVANSSENFSCDSYVFEPLHVSAGDLLPAIHDDDERCDGSKVVGSRLILNGPADKVSKTRILLNRLDRPKPVARMFVLIAANSESTELGADLEGFTGRVPAPDFFDSLQITAAYAESSGWRTLEIVTDGESSSNVTQTDRVQGNVIVTDGGSQVSGVENRTVGLSLNISGVVTSKGYRGRVSFSDSSLDGDVTRTSSCGAYVSLQLHSLTRVCSYERDDNSRKASILKGSKTRNDDNLTVYVGLMSHETASLETLRKLIK